jgi:hypothetical protein
VVRKKPDIMPAFTQLYLSSERGISFKAPHPVVCVGRRVRRNGRVAMNVAAQMQLPDIEEVKQPAMLERLTAEAAGGDTRNWEAGGQSNFMIAAARLGLRVASAANVGQDVYGTFLRDILQVTTPLFGLGIHVRRHLGAVFWDQAV